MSFINRRIIYSLGVISTLISGYVVSIAQSESISFVEFATARTADKFSQVGGTRSADFRSVCDFHSNRLAARVLREYGAIFSATQSVKVPKSCIFENEQSVLEFRKSLDAVSEEIDGTVITLQREAMADLKLAVGTAIKRGVRITPLDGAIAGDRTYEDTLRLWRSRFEPALRYWTRKGKIKRAEADEANDLSPVQQVIRVVEWESKGLYFSTGFNRSIFSSVAPPGTSQHLSLLAFDVVQYGSAEVRRILNEHGWYQTVVGDEPHFTYLGVKESELPKRGLRSVTRGKSRFWVPAM